MLLSLCSTQLLFEHTSSLFSWPICTANSLFLDCNSLSASPNWFLLWFKSLTIPIDFFHQITYQYVIFFLVPDKIIHFMTSECCLCYCCILSISNSLWKIVDIQWIYAERINKSEFVFTKKTSSEPFTNYVTFTHSLLFLYTK